MKKKRIFLFLLFITFFSLSSCQKVVKSYEDMNEIVYRSIFAQKGNSYYVYFYRPYVSENNNCPACERVKDVIFDYANRQLYPIYLINTNNKKINEGMMKSCHPGEDCDNVALNAKVYTDISIATVPYLILIQNGQVIKVFDGVTEIRNELTMELRGV